MTRVRRGEGIDTFDGMRVMSLGAHGAESCHKAYVLIKKSSVGRTVFSLVRNRFLLLLFLFATFANAGIDRADSLPRDFRFRATRDGLPWTQK